MPKAKPGFTLIESLIVIMITGLLFVFSAPKIQSFRLKNHVKATHQELKAQLQQFHTWSTAVKSGTPVDPATTDFNNRLVAYAVHITAPDSSYTVWEVWEKTDGTPATFDDTPAERKQTFTLPNEVSINSINPPNTDIQFNIPFGDVTGTFDADHTIKVEIEFRSFTREISIHQSGNIY